MAPNFGAKSKKFAYPPSFVAPAFQNGLEDHNADARRLNGHDPSTLRKNSVKFDPVNLKFTRQNVYIVAVLVSNRVCLATIRQRETVFRTILCPAAGCPSRI